MKRKEERRRKERKGNSTIEVKRMEERGRKERKGNGTCEEQIRKGGRRKTEE